ncbi:hypothetical protein [Paenibacillus sp. DMB20]|uniref:hypothetical protein n=1 Tax=Paenibacillus sp. DMB20 TaxID=1642570 RepID=UPI0006278DF6|nr:hypothetical protein [Paenibacillus sp. DMB20]KKO53339.1 hypothetical protein XI25_13525 [Paenibacillus sp. DMB20]
MTVIMSVLKYLLVSYTRSYRYFGPVAFVIITVLFLYSYKPNPVMDSYAVTSSILFIGCAWLGLSFLNHDQGRQTGLLVLHSGSALTFYIAQFAAIVLLAACLSAGAVLYPMLTGMFNEPVGWMRFLTALSAHVSLSLLGAAIALFFQNGWIENYGRAAGMMLVLIVFSFAGLSLGSQLPEYAKWVIYLLPPVSPMVDMMMHDSERLLWEKAGMIAYSLGYTAFLLVVYLKAACSKDTADLIRKAG